jgi:hypothetical protein
MGKKGQAEWMNEGRLSTDSNISEDLFEDQPRVRDIEGMLSTIRSRQRDDLTFACQAEMSGEPPCLAHYDKRVRSVAVEQLTI